MQNINPSHYPTNGYLKGMCPGCKEWEAPLTEDELRMMKEPYANHGRSVRVLDPNALYHRVTWTEYFQCPKCKARFGVRYSNT